MFQRNINMTYIIFNNGGYGLTKGQASPTLTTPSCSSALSILPGKGGHQRGLTWRSCGMCSRLVLGRVGPTHSAPLMSTGQQLMPPPRRPGRRTEPRGHGDGVARVL